MQLLSSMFRFKGGIHPSYRKELSNGGAIRVLPMPKTLLVPMSQHLGAPAKPIVKPGDTLKKYQQIAEAGGFISAPIHAPAGGKVTKLEQVRTASGGTCQAIAIAVDENAEEVKLPPIEDWENAEPKDLLARVAEAGIVGMGGAGFPTKVKLSPPPGKVIDTLILNGAECEPYLTSDHRMMVEQAEGIRLGAEIMRRILAVKSLRIAVEDNKPDAIEALEKAFSGVAGDVAIVRLKTLYPQGGEKQQIFSVTGREVPRGALPMDAGCVVENISTVYSIWDAVVNGIPSVRRVVTVTGDAIAEPCNILAPFGTSYRELIDFAGGFKTAAAKVVSGGPMMGFAVADLAIPTGKTTSGITCLPAKEVDNYVNHACISCGRCVEACPMRLVPSEMSQHIEAEDIDGAVKWNLTDCIECGCCAFVCPAKRPLVQHFRRGKAIIREKAAAARAAAQAKAEEKKN